MGGKFAGQGMVLGWAGYNRAEREEAGRKAEQCEQAEGMADSVTQEHNSVECRAELKV